MADIDGRKTGGRALSAVKKRTAEQGTALVTEVQSSLEDLTPEEIEAMGPREVLMRAMRRHLRDGGLNSAVKIAMDLMPYHHAKKTSVPEQDPDAATTAEIARDPDPEVKD